MSIGPGTELGERYDDPSQLRLGQVYLTASDQPLREFVDQLPVYFDLLEGLTVTAAVNDPVLGMAKISDGKIRLGAVGEEDGVELNLEPDHEARLTEILQSDRMVLVDLEHVPEAHYKFSHGGWYDSPWISTDVMVTLLGGLSAEERGLVSRQVERARVWSFPPDYMERIKASILERQGNDQAQMEPGS